MKKIHSLFVLLCIAAMAHAVPASPVPFEYTMPDGTVVMAVLHGDEYHSYITDLEGNLLEGTIPTQEEYMAIRRKSPIQHAAQAGGNFPLKGSPKSVAILLNFQDKKFQYTREDFVNLLNQSGYSVNGATGSCRDYFIACSDSLFTPQFDVWGPYTVRGNMKDYGAPKGGQHDTDPGAAFIEACQLAAEAGVDFAQYDTDNDGIIDNVFFYYAGNNQAEGAPDYTIWPHQSNLQYRNIKLNGKLLASYACTSELRGANSNTMCPIGTFCHEFGHVLGLPDMYDTSDGGGYTVGGWDIMANGNYNNNGRTPPSYSGYERFYLGWRKPVQLINPNEYTLTPLATGGEIYLLADGEHNLSPRSPSPNEFFMIEYRDRTGWDQPADALPGTGILVWHIDYSAQAWAANNLNNEKPLRYHLEEAGGNRNYSSATDPYPGSTNITAFTPKLHDGTVLSTQPIYDIKAGNGLASFIYISRGEQHLHAYPAEAEIETTIGANGKPEQWEAYAIHLTGEQLGSNETFTLTVPSKNQFKMTFDPALRNNRTSTKWMRTLTLSNAVSEEGKLDTTLYINFNPQKQNCEVETASLSIQSDSNRLNIVLNGFAPRHTYVSTPVLKAATDITPYSFTANWKAVEDVEEYYITVFQSEKGESEITQDFEQFDKASMITEQGWNTNFVATTTSWKKDGVRSLLLKNNGDQVTTEQYQAPLSHISFYLNALSADVDTIGDLVIDASKDGKTWTNIDTLRLPARTKAKIFHIDIPVENGCTQIRMTYWDLGGKGVAMDQFVATMSEKITYLYRGRDLKISSISETPTTCVIGGLKPENTYYYQIQCTDGDKGCEEHLTPLSEAKKITTTPGIDIDEDDKHLGLLYNKETHTVCVPQPSSDARLYVLDRMGQQIYSVREADGQYTYPLPTAGFTRGQLYIVKQVENGRVRRKQRYVKFVY